MKVSTLAKQGLAELRFIMRRISVSKRSLPDFVILGGQRCGTTSLYNYLTSHPSMRPSLRKEVHFFDNNYYKGINWYRAHFPIITSADEITGEASPYYLPHPLVPKRIHDTESKYYSNPIKLIVLLRNPVERAISHYKHELRSGHESLSILEAFEAEPERIRAEEKKLADNESYYSYELQHFSYLRRGIYVEQLKRWFSYFDRKQFFIASSEELFERPDEVYKNVLGFLGLEAIDIPHYEVYNKTKELSIEKDLYLKLASYFEPFNRELYQLLDKNLGWD